MSKREQITTIVAIAFLYTVITSIFSILHRLSTLIVAQGTLYNRIFWFLQRNTLWILVVTAIIIIILTIYKKNKPKRAYRYSCESDYLFGNRPIGYSRGYIVFCKYFTN